MGIIKTGGRLHVRGNISVGAGAAVNFTDATTAAGNTTTLFIPHSTAVGTGTAVIATNGQFLVGQRAAGSPCLITRLNGTSYYVALTAV